MFGFVWILSSCFGLAVVFYGLLLCSLNFELELEYNTNIVYTKKMRSFSIPKLRLLFHVWLLNSHRRTSLLENLCVAEHRMNIVACIQQQASYPNTQRGHVVCILSNMVVGWFRSLESIEPSLRQCVNPPMKY